MTHITIRDAILADVDSAAAVHRASAIVAYADIFPPSSVPPTVQSLQPGWRALIEDTTSHVFVAEADQTVVGVVAVAADSTLPSGLALSRLYVRPDFWRQQIGARLHEAAIDHVRSLGADAINLWVLEANSLARAMYERRGWKLQPGFVLENDPPEIVDVLYQLDLSG